jgi:2-methylfumaryl-CoA isomerase
MYGILKDLTVVEAASFVAGPSCALHLNQMGAQVIRIEAVGGGPDARRWPLANGTGDSLYWEGLNKGKLSIAIDLASAEGRELAVTIITAPGPGRGLFVTNFPAKGFLAHERLAARRADLITVRVMGWPDGRNAVDYTVNAAVGLPYMTGPLSLPQHQPVNSVLPAWDIATGALAAFTLMTALHHRQQTGAGGEYRLALSDVAIGMLGNLGQVAEVLGAGDRTRSGNGIFGAYGRDFPTLDGRRVMIVAITPKQWESLLDALDLTQAVATLETTLGTSFATDEGERFRHAGALDALIEAATALLPHADLARRFEAAQVCWEPYQTLTEAVTQDPRLVLGNEVFSEIDHPSGLRYPAPGAMVRAPGLTRQPPVRAPRLGEHTDQILADHLGLTGPQIGRLHDLGVVAGPSR